MHRLRRIIKLNHDFEDIKPIKTIQLLINTNKIQKLYNIVTLVVKVNF